MPLLISSVKFAVIIIQDMIVISKFHVPGVTPTVNTQAATQLVCGLTASFAGLLYFNLITARQRRTAGPAGGARPSLIALKALARPGFFAFVESAIRNAGYLWLVTGIVAMGSDFVTAWGVSRCAEFGLPFEYCN